MAKWVQIDGKKFEKCICGLDILMCSECGFTTYQVIDRFKENGVQKIRYIHRSRCPNCFAKMEKYS